MEEKKEEKKEEPKVLKEEPKTAMLPAQTSPLVKAPEEKKVPDSAGLPPKKDNFQMVDEFKTSLHVSFLRMINFVIGGDEEEQV